MSIPRKWWLGDAKSHRNKYFCLCFMRKGWRAPLSSPRKSWEQKSHPQLGNSRMFQPQFLNVFMKWGAGGCLGLPSPAQGGHQPCPGALGAPLALLVGMCTALKPILEEKKRISISCCQLPLCSSQGGVLTPCSNLVFNVKLCK